jgi:hypothetical protein
MKSYHIPSSKLSAIQLGTNGSKSITVSRERLSESLKIASQFPAGSHNRYASIVDALQDAEILNNTTDTEL